MKPLTYTPDGSRFIQLVVLVGILFLSSCIAPDSAMQGAAAQVVEKPLNVRVARAFPNLRFERPVIIENAGDGSDRIFVCSQLGKIHVFPNDQSVQETQVFLDITSKVVYKDRENEEGLLGLAFHPNYGETGYFYVYYTTVDAPHTSVISRFSVSNENPNQADANSEVELMRIEQPFWNHNGGTLIFGPDGYLYVGLGDGGSANDPYGNGQNLRTWLGSILRIDVDRPSGDKPYGIPNDNPFVNRRGAQPEIWAYGFRNIWRMEFDEQTGVLWAADVGQDTWEEIDLVVRGGNYGWNLREGMHPFGASGSPPREDLIEPIWEYHHDVGKSITGGLVYRGSRAPELRNMYLYSDYVSGKLWALQYDHARNRVVAKYTLEGPTNPWVTYGEDEQQEAYISDIFGMLYYFEPVP